MTIFNFSQHNLLFKKNYDQYIIPLDTLNVTQANKVAINTCNAFGKPLIIPPTAPATIEATINDTIDQVNNSDLIVLFNFPFSLVNSTQL